MDDFDTSPDWWQAQDSEKQQWEIDMCNKAIDEWKMEGCNEN